MSHTRILATVGVLALALPLAHAADRPDDLGMKVRQVPDGLEVLGVTPRALPDQLELKQTDVILAVNGREVRTREALEEALFAKRERFLVIRVRRPNRQENIRAEVSWPPNRPPIVMKKTLEGIR